MFPLRGQATVLGDDGPAVAHLANVTLASVDHRLDGENHAFLQLDPCAGLAVMQDLRVFMKFLADAVAAKFPHDGITARFRVFLDGMTDVAQRSARFDLLDASPHTLVGDVAKALGLRGGGADAEHAAGITVIAILDGRDVEVDDVTIFQHAISGHAVAYLLVDRGADGLRVGRMAWGRVIQGGGDAALHVDHVIVA